MVKKEARKKEVSRDVERLNSILVENFVKLQKAMTNITLKFDNLSDQISKLLQLFEISAKSFAEKLETGIPEIEKDREFLEKLNRLLEQNKVIAKGLTLMEDKLRERVYGSSAHSIQRPMLRNPTMPPSGGYIPSSIEEEKREIE